MRKIIGIGETILDIIFQDNQPQRAVPGGSTFNCMVSLARCNMPVSFISELGKDRVGEVISDFMKENNLVTDYVCFFEEGLSPVSMAFLNEKKDAQYVFYKDFPRERLNVNFPLVKENDIVILSSYFAVNPVLRKKVVTLLQAAKEENAIIYYDINFRKPHAAERKSLMNNFMENFQYASVIRCSDEDLDILFPNLDIDTLYSKHILPYQKTLIITRGAQSVIVKTPLLDKNYKVDPIVPVSTIGAGDNFNAGFVYGLMKDEISITDLNNLPLRQWNKLIGYATMFAAEVCASYDNYISWEFARKMKRE